MTHISHSVIGIDQYVLKAFDEKIALVRRTKAGFYAETIFDEVVECSTMRDLKEAVQSILDKQAGFVERATAVPTYLTVDQARQKFGISHSRVRSLLVLIKRCWPYVRPHQLGTAMAYLAATETAKWEWGQEARQWLVDNKDSIPVLREVNWEIYDRYNRVEYVK